MQKMRLLHLCFKVHIDTIADFDMQSMVGNLTLLLVSMCSLVLLLCGRASTHVAPSHFNPKREIYAPRAPRCAPRAHRAYVSTNPFLHFSRFFRVARTRWPKG